MARIKHVVRSTLWALALCFGLGILWSVIVGLNAREAQRQQLIDLCALKGLEAVDLDYPHTPKCLDLNTGLMTVPRDFYKARGGRL